MSLAFQQQQMAFAAHIRNPEVNPIPDKIEERRMAIYNELFFNNINSQLSTNFPVIREICSDEYWQAMMRDFLIKHRCETPLFTEVGLEFIDYLQNEREAQEDDFPFLLELAHYEYVELAVYISTADEELGDYDANGDLLNQRPLIAPTAWVLSYQYPVHQIGPDFIPQEPGEQPSNLVVYRDRQDEVHFLEINPVTMRLLQILQENNQKTGLQAIQQIAEELQHPEPNSVITAGIELLNDLRQRNVVIGTEA